MCHAKTAEPIKVPSEVWTRLGPRNDVLDGGPDPYAEAILRRKGAEKGLSAASYAKTANSIEVCLSIYPLGRGPAYSGPIR